MKKILKAAARWEYLAAVVFAAAVLCARAFGFAAADAVSVNFWGFFSQMILVLPAVFIAVGIFDVWIPHEKVARHLGSGSGIKGVMSVIFLASLQAGPLYGAFPVAYVMWKKGASPRNIFIYLGAYSTIKISMLTFETGFLGIKFSLLRAALTLPVYVAIGYMMEKYFGKNFSMRSPVIK